MTEQHEKNNDINRVVSCHKIEHIEGPLDNGTYLLHLEGGGATPSIMRRWFEVRKPAIGGYFLTYEGGYTGFSANSVTVTVPEKHDVEAEPMIRHFAFSHLPQSLAAVSRPFCALAESIVRDLPRSAERTKCLNELLMAKDWAVRAMIDMEAS